MCWSLSPAGCAAAGCLESGRRRAAPGRSPAAQQVDTLRWRCFAAGTPRASCVKCTGCTLQVAGWAAKGGCMQVLPGASSSPLRMWWPCGQCCALPVLTSGWCWRLHCPAGSHVQPGALTPAMQRQDVGVSDQQAARVILGPKPGACKAAPTHLGPKRAELHGRGARGVCVGRSSAGRWRLRTSLRAGGGKVKGCMDGDAMGIHPACWPPTRGGLVHVGCA